MSKVECLLKDRFRGALIGVLVGDCYGAPFERSRAKADAVTKFIEQKSGESSPKDTSKILKYTDDTVMTKATCRSLLKSNGFNANDLARDYSESYFSEPKRGYGPAVRTVFKTLRKTNYNDPFGPAAEQFEGRGSYGNGAAMRCCGQALYAFNNKFNPKQTLDLAENCAKITHNHSYGINGAALLVIATKYVLGLEPETLKEQDFLDELIGSMEVIEESNDQIYVKKLKIIKDVIEKLSINGADVNQEQIVALLGNDVTAPGSVPLAIYSFLRGISKFTDAYNHSNEFIRTLHWAISCGGDTDTIAAMACSISGAYLGLANIPEGLYKICESWEDMFTLADKLATPRV